MRKRMIAMLLCIATMLSLCTGFASAASSTIAGALGEVNITNGDYKMSYLSMNGVVRSQSYTYFNFKSASGAIKEIPAYCINPTTKGVPQSVSPGTSIKYIANEASNDPKIYPHRGLSELKLDNKYQAYYATKMALWCYLIDGWSIDRLTVNPSLSGVEKERGEKLLAAAKDIYKRGTWWNRVPQPTITVTADKDSAYPVTIDGKEYLQQVFTADSETWVCDYDIDIGFTMPDEVPEGTRIVDMNNNDITKIRTSPNGASYAGQFKVLYPKDSVSDQTGAVQMSLHANVYKYAIYYALCAETSKYGTLQRYMCDTAPTTEIRQSTFSRYSATPSDTPDEPETSTETTLIIKKVETGTNTPLSGATFEVKAPDGTVLGSFVTDTSGKIIIPLTLSGQYVITEKAAPKWHLLGTETTKTVSVDYGNTATVTFENAPYGNLRVDKIDASIIGSAGDSSTSVGTGGMITKIRASRILMTAGIASVICSGSASHALVRIAKGESVGTLFVPPAGRLDIAPRKLWIALGDKAHGAVVVDDGAVRALKDHGSSLLAVGIRLVEGSFAAGDILDVKDKGGMVVARGIAEADSDTLELAAGRRQENIESNRLLAQLAGKPAIHRDNLIVFA